ncbi:hypothetical protein CERZMDRAFT_85577 [Cercospora zeae-maydis SCOH1-5]|uniref:Uncharacterized protein n=1 Tax=Cercospora zeae-maydis SCOH1-5 TaxID=717836 RepID=A0A6A6FC66_9PEZI|nr:hypothetical protein CERZMDRAFT_85577 [Cercospora zeae-maydis SCOH1-5]
MVGMEVSWYYSMRTANIRRHKACDKGCGERAATHQSLISVAGHWRSLETAPLDNPPRGYPWRDVANNSSLSFGWELVAVGECVAVVIMWQCWYPREHYHFLGFDRLSGSEKYNALTWWGPLASRCGWNCGTPAQGRTRDAHALDEESATHGETRCDSASSTFKMSPSHEETSPPSTGEALIWNGLERGRASEVEDNGMVRSLSYGTEGAIDTV